MAPHGILQTSQLQGSTAAGLVCSGTGGDGPVVVLHGC